MQKLFVTTLSCLLLAGCSSLPTSGPSEGSVMDMGERGSDQYVPDVDVIDMNDAVIGDLYDQNRRQSFTQFHDKGSLYAGRVKVGDTLEVMIWEAPPAVLFGNVLNEAGTGSAQLTTLPEQVVNKQGKITVPFIGAVTAKGKTPEQIQNTIVSRLKRMANQPQALVRLSKNNTTAVTVLREGNSVRLPLTEAGEKVLDAVAAAGGATGGIQDVSVQLARGKEVKTLALEVLASTPSENIALRSGDVLTLLNNPLSFTALGAVGSNQQVRFSAKGINLAEAIAQMGGLLDSRSDPEGIFVFRYKKFRSLDERERMEWQAKGYGPGMDIPLVYRFNLLDPRSMFWLQRFSIRDKDVVYVANAPLAEFQKFLRMVFSITSPVTSTINSTKNL